MAGVASYDGGDSVGVRYRNLGSDKVTIMLEEDKSKDAEINHTTETVNFLALSGDGFLTGADQNYVYPPSITVTSPNGDERIKAGKNYNFTWNDNIQGNVRLELYQGNTLKHTLTSSTPSDGSYIGALPDDFFGGYNYKLKVSSIDNSSIFDWSDDTLSIARKPNHTVTSPNGGDVFTAGQNYDFTWHNDIYDSVRLDLYQGDTLVQNITPGIYTYTVEKDRSYNWTLPEDLTPGSNYRFKVTSIGYGSEDYDYSDAYFTVASQPQITLTSFNDGKVIAPGENVSIIWTDNIDENVNISLYRDNAYVRAIAVNTPSDGQVSWTVPTDLPLSDRYKIKIYQSGGGVSDWSNNYFSIY